MAYRIQTLQNRNCVWGPKVGDGVEAEVGVVYVHPAVSDDPDFRDLDDGTIVRMTSALGLVGWSVLSHPD